MNKVKILLISPFSFDVPTFASCAWATTLCGRLREYPNVEVKYDWIFVNSLSLHAIEKVPFDLLIYFGHGTPDSLAFNFFDQITPESHSALFANKIIFTMACNAGRSFGKSVVANGAKAFVGYDQEVPCVLDNLLVRQFGQDFGQIYFSEIALLLQEYTVRETSRIIKNAWIQLAQFYQGLAQNSWFAGEFLKHSQLALSVGAAHVAYGEGKLLKVIP